MDELTIEKTKEHLLLALGWLQENLHFFSLRESDGKSDVRDCVAKMKPISELSLTLLVLRRSRIDIPALRTMSEWAWQEAEEGKYLARLLLARNDFLPSCAYYASMYQMGFRCPALHTVVSGIAQTNMARVLPLQPWARLALNYNLEQLNIWQSDRQNHDGLYINNCPEPWILSSETGYAITHEVFYLTDFGAQKIPNPLVIDYLMTWLPYWSDRLLHEGNHDLAGEFVMAHYCITNNPQSWANDTLLRIGNHQNEDGSFDGQQGAGSFLYGRDDAPEWRNFLRTYHTTLVFIMATSLTLRCTQNKT